ncbi:hypothetical protein HU200_025090 [Digitaria exilis]|uniref:Uncharacterized protein n=1 Tax=Digitaria exilis TaxID=1010633 RepID=A0A835EVP0_9POAL|nr:hypothetical protein HU200_025090 [Digitaria exilis]
MGERRDSLCQRECMPRPFGFVFFMCSAAGKSDYREIDRSRLQQNAGGVRLLGILFWFWKKGEESSALKAAAAAAQTRRRRTCKCAAFHAGTRPAGWFRWRNI